MLLEIISVTWFHVSKQLNLFYSISREIEEREEEYVEQRSGECIDGLRSEGPSGEMKMLSWNCRGMLSTTAVQEFLEIQGCIRAEVVFLSESHLNKIEADELRCKLGFNSMFLVESDGKAGGLVPFYQSENKTELNYLSSHFIDVMFMNDTVVDWRFMGFYGLPSWNEKHLSWTGLRQLHALESYPWVVIGDFNEIVFSHEKEGGNARPNAMMREFRNFWANAV